MFRFHYEAGAVWFGSRRLSEAHGREILQHLNQALQVLIETEHPDLAQTVFDSAMGLIAARVKARQYHRRLDLARYGGRASLRPPL